MAVLKAAIARLHQSCSEQRASAVGAILMAALAWCSAGCSSDAGTGLQPGAVAGAGGGGSDGGATAGSNSGGTGGPTTGGKGSAAVLPLPAGEKPGPRLHRLTRSELQHSLQDLLGEDVPIAGTDPDNVVGGFASIGASSVSVSPAGVGLYEGAIRAATDFVFAEPARVSARLPCVPSAVSDMNCLTSVVTKLGRRAFRRALTDAEVQRYTGLASTIGGKAGSNVLTGLRHAVSALLQSPSFLYRVELGAASAADGGRLKYTDFEIASRLAATLWDSVPDDALLDAAQAGMLGTPEGVKAQAERLLADARSQRAVSAFADELFGMKHLEEATKDLAVFPTWTDTLKAAMHEEISRRVQDIVFVRKGDFLSLYDDRVTFVNNELARHYGLPEQPAKGFFRAEFPADSPRAGILGAGAILAGFALPQRTSPTFRGKFVAESLLCRIVPPPPPGVPPLPAMAAADATLRERLDLHREAPSCAGCHALMDPMGFGMEDFDSVGLYRTKDGVKPVDATGSLTGEGLDGSTFDGLAQLGAAMRKQPVLAPCLVSKLYAEAQGRIATELDRVQLGELVDSFSRSENRLDQLLLSLVASESFRFVEPKG